MIKGVVKNYIEINPRNNEDFEKIIVILKNPPDQPDDDEIINSAMLMLGKSPNCIRSNNRYFLKMLICGLSGSLITTAAIMIYMWFV